MTPRTPMIRSAGAQTLVFLGGLGIATAAFFAFAIVAARQLGPETFGRLQVVLDVLVLLSIVGKLGFDEAVSYEIPRITPDGSKSVRPLILHALVFSGLFSIALAAGVVGTGDFLERSVLPLPGIAGDLWMAWPLLPITTLLAVSTACLRGMGRSDLRTLTRDYLASVLLLGLLGYAYSGGLTVAEAYAVRVVPVGLVTIIAVALALRSRKEPVPFDSAARLRLHALAASTLVITIVNYVLQFSHRILGSNLVSSYELGNYGAAASLANLGVLFPTALANTIGPALAASIAAAREEDALQLYAAASRWLLRGTAALLGPLIALRHDAVWIFGEQYVLLPDLFAILAAGYLVSAALGLNTPMLMARNRQRAEVVVGLVCTAAFWGGAVVLSRFWGPAGLAAALAGAMAGANLLRLVLLGRDGRRGILTTDAMLIAGSIAAGLVVMEWIRRMPHLPHAAWIAAGAYVAVLGLAHLAGTLRRGIVEDLRVLFKH
ncbi:MAG: oligosaccharide flippase family protein [Planctomycetes bacterium]|nr:oligosaccharide flippase family protein [Planctomycetota bacterium]